MKKRFMAMLMTAMLVIASVPFTAFAEEAPAEVLGGEVAEAAAAEITEVMAAEAVQAEEAPAAEEPGEAPAETAEPAADTELLGGNTKTVETYIMPEDIWNCRYLHRRLLTKFLTQRKAGSRQAIPMAVPFRQMHG